MKYITLFTILFCSTILAMDPVLYESPKKPWEAAYKTGAIARYSAAELVTHFQDLRLPTTAVPAHVTTALGVIVTHATGKEVISDIVARLEPQIHYINSLQAIITHISANKDNLSTAPSAAKAFFGLLSFLDPNSINNKHSAELFVATVGNALLLRLENDPTPITPPDFPRNTYLDDSPIDLSIEFANAAHTFLDGVVKLVKDKLDGDRFQFGDTEDSYNPTNKTISVRNAVFKVSKVTGPKLFTYGTQVGFIAKDIDFLIDERLFHEILHYDHITLRKEIFTDISLLGKLLIGNGFYPSYTGILQGLWTNSEEFRTITGLFERGGQLRYFRQSEYRYLADKGNFLRCGHSSSYCTKVPAYFIKLINDKTGVIINLQDTTDRDYVKQYDEI